LNTGELVLGHVDDDFRLDVFRDGDDRLALCDDWPDLELHARDDTVLRRAQRRVLEAIARELELAGLRFGGSVRRLRMALCLLVVGRS
jgi:hypothetical protein